MSKKVIGQKSCPPLLYRFMSGYGQDLDGPLLDYTMKKYRRIPDVTLVEVQAAFGKLLR